jgi:rhombotail lipoprotein
MWNAVLCHPHCQSEARASSSLVSYLYPSGEEPPSENRIPELRLPVRVGLAFMPARPGAQGPGLEASRREELLERIRQRFADRKFVREIVIVPDYYLANTRGFEGLAGAQRLYNVDLMALVSYDQVTYRDDNSWSFGYLTIVGAYVLKGSRHDVTTLMDLAVVDPATRSILLRAGGTDHRHGTTTLIDEGRQTRESSTEGFGKATDQLIEHFDSALAQFESDVRAGKANVRVAGNESGGRVGGSLDFTWLAFLAAVLVFLRRRSRSA